MHRGEERYALLLERLGERSLYVQGEPGAGKSTFCRWVALVSAAGRVPEHGIPAPEGFREALPEGLEGRFPLLCRLREWAGEAACLAGNGHWTRKQLETALACWVDAVEPGGLSGAFLREQLRRGRCLLVLDGDADVTPFIDFGDNTKAGAAAGGK